jgi:hypothetical protein
MVGLYAFYARRRVKTPRVKPEMIMLLKIVWIGPFGHPGT